MWPTFYLPALIRAMNSIGASHICGVVTGTPTIPTPANAEAGQAQVVVLSSASSFSALMPAADGNPWILLFDATTATNVTGVDYGRAQRVYWRIYDPADGDFTATANLSQVAYLSVTFSNANATDPLAAFAMFTQRKYSYDATPMFAGNGTGFDAAQENDFVLFLSHAASLSSVEMSSDNEPPADTPGVLFSCTNNTSGTPQTSHTLTGMHVVPGAANNLLRNSRSLSSASWTATGVTNAADSSGQQKWRVCTPSGSGKHYLEQEVDLTAGETYLFAARIFAEAGVAPWLTYVKPDNSEHGFGAVLGSVTTLSLPSGGEVDPTDITHGCSVTCPDVWSGNAAGTLSMLIRPDITGTYKLRLHILRDTATPEDAGSSSSSQIIRVVNTLLQRGPDCLWLPCWFPESDDPFEEGSTRWPLIVTAYGDERSDTAANTNYGDCLVLALRRGGGTRPPCTLFAPQLRNLMARFDDLELTHSWADYVNTSPEYEYPAVGSSHLVYHYLPQKKFYYEATITTLGTATGAAEISAGVSVAFTAQLVIGANAPVGNVTGQFAYRASGAVRVAGANEAIVDAWADGDIIGIGIDFENWEITYYLNGTLQHTSDISAYADRYAPFMAHIGWFSQPLRNSGASMAVNFAGPFGGRKPAGFAAWDFDNEVT